MRRQKCHQCGTMLDVSNLEKGSKTACFNCGAINVVGEAAVVKRSLKDSGKAFERRAAKEDAPTVKRSRRRAAAAPGADTKSKMPLFLGIGGAVVVVVVILVVLLNKSGGPAAPKGPTAADWWTTKTTKIALADKATLESWIAEAKEKGYDQDEAFWAPKLEEIMKHILKRDPQDDRANKYAKRKSLREYPDFDKIWEGMNKHYAALPDEQRAFMDKYAPLVDRKQPVWMPQAEYEKAAATLAEIKAWVEKREANPAAEKIQKAIRTASALLKDHDFVTGVEGPFILLLPYNTKDADADAKKADLEQKLELYKQPLRVALDQFEKKYREPLGLDPITEGHYFVQVILDKREDFEKFIRGETGFEPVGDVQGFFAAKTTQWAGTAAGRDDETKPYLGPDLAHEATHQLQYYFSKDWKKKWDPNYFPEWNCIWFTEGLAEYVGGGVKYDPATGKSEWTGIAKRRVEFLQGMKDNGVPLIPLRDLIQLNTNGEWQRYIHDTWIPLLTENEDMPVTASQWLDQQPGVASSAMYAHAWLLTRFLNESSDGKYAKQYRDLLMTALRGKAKPEAYRKNKNVRERWAKPFDAFVEILGVSGDDGWKKLQKQYERYLSRALREARG